MRFIKLLHLALSCLFAPMLIVYALSGAEMIESIDDLITQDSMVDVVQYNMSKIHTDSRLSTSIKEYISTDPFRTLVVVMGIGVALMSILGVIAGLGTQGVRVIAFLFLMLGFAIPGAIIWFQ